MTPTCRKLIAMTPEQILDMRKVLMECCSWSGKDVQDLPLDDLEELYQLVMLDKDRVRQEVDR